MRLQSFREKNSISETQVLLISACLQEDKDLCEDLVKKWENLVDISDLDYSSSRLVPYFLHHLQKLNIFSVHDKRLKIIYKHWWLRSKQLNYELDRINTILCKSDTEQVLYKGSSIKEHYEKPELRTMSDLDLLIRAKDVDRVIPILEALNYEHVGAFAILSGTAQSIYKDFYHSINFKHKYNDSRIDLHWDVGSDSSKILTEVFWANLTHHDKKKKLYKPSIAYEVFMILIHAINSNSHDNLNWILDIHVINKKYAEDFWQEVAAIAELECALNLFYEGCSILREFGINAPEPGLIQAKRSNIVLSENSFSQLNWFRKFQVRISNVIYMINRKYPKKSEAFKLHQFLRFIQFYLLYKISKMRKVR